MVCTERNCSVPGQWTLPAAILNVSAGGVPSVRTKGEAKPHGPSGKLPAIPDEMSKTQEDMPTDPVLIARNEVRKSKDTFPERQNRGPTDAIRKLSPEKLVPEIMRKSYLLWNRPAKDGGVMTNELTPLDILPGASSEVRTVAFAPDGKLVAFGAKNGTLFVWEIKRGRAASEFTNIRGHQNGVESLAFSPNGKQLATGGWDHLVKLWDVAGGTISSDPLWIWQGTSHGGRPVAFSPDGKTLVLGSVEGYFTVLNTATGRQVRRNSDPARPVHGVHFSPDGTLLALALGDRTTVSSRESASSPTGVVHMSDSPAGEVQIWDWAHNKIRAKLIGWNGECISVKFSPDGTLLAATGGREARLYETVTFHQKSILESASPMTGLDFRPDGKLLATSCWAGNVIFWDPSTGECRGFIQDAHNGNIPAIDFSPDGRLLATASADGLVKLWDVQEPAVAAPASGR